MIKNWPRIPVRPCVGMNDSHCEVSMSADKSPIKGDTCVSYGVSASSLQKGDTPKQGRGVAMRKGDGDGCGVGEVIRIRMRYLAGLKKKRESGGD